MTEKSKKSNTQIIPAVDLNYLELHSSKCVTCSHLFPTHPKAKAHNSCHYKKGNDRCPAAELRFVIGVDKNEQVENILKSFEEDDIQGLIEQLNTLVKIPKEQRRGLLSDLLKTFKR